MGSEISVKTALTARQQEVLDVIKAFRRAHGKSPTVREIAKLVGIGSPNGVVCHLLALAKKGLIRWDRRQARSIIPLDEVDQRDESIRILLGACEFVADWLSSFSMPPTSTIQEKQEALAVLDAAIQRVKKGVFSSAAAV